jgi:ubiquitin C-terminal hydrolase
MSISLPLTLPVPTQSGAAPIPLSMERCLHHFVAPEMLADPVDCPSCGKKTPTKKQHVISSLPKVLCLHFKRFDAAQNRKIESFVSFPAKNLNMGPFLPHWCEITRVPESEPIPVEAPPILYNLFGTVNHFGTMQSGHYVANVLVDDLWYHCNDAHISRAGVGSGEAEVLSSNAYMLIYIRDVID